MTDFTPENVDAGDLELDVVADTSGLAAELRTKLARLANSTTIDLPVDPDTRQVKARLRAKLRGADVGSISVPVAPDMAGFRQRLRTALRTVDTGSVKVRVDPDFARWKTRLNDAARRTDTGSVKVRVDPDMVGFKQRLKAAVASAGDTSVKVGVTVDRRDLRAAVAQAQRGNRETVEFDTDLDSRGLGVKARAARVSAQAQAGSISVPMVIDSGGLRGFDPMALLKIPAVIAGVGLAAGAVSALAAGFVALAGAIAPAAGALGVIPGLALAAAAGIGAVVTGFSGVGNALKTASKAQETAAADAQAASASQAAASKAAAAAQEAAAKRVVAAQQRVKDAQRAVAGSQRALADAQRQADQTSVDGAERVAQARDNVGRVAEDGARQIASAEERVQAAQADSVNAQQDLTRAREDAMQRLQDMRLQLSGAALDEEGAALAVRRAAERMREVDADPGASVLDRQEADLAFREALQRQAEVRERNEELRKEAAKAAKEGVEGSDQVTAAKARVADAAKSERDAETELARARTDAAKASADAQRQVTAAQKDAARANAAAARSVADAQRQVGEAQRRVGDATRDVRDAQREYVQAQRAGADAGRKQATNAAAAQAAMAKLTPEAREFVGVVQQLVKRWASVTEEVQRRLFPGLTTGLARVTRRYIPLLREGLGGVADEVGTIGDRVSRLVTTDAWTSDFAKGMKTNRTVTRLFGDMLLDVLDIARNVTMASRPLLLRFTRWLRDSLDTLRELTQDARDDGSLRAFFKDAGDVAAQLGRILGHLSRALFRVFSGGRESGQGFLDTIEEVVARFDGWTASLEGQNALRQWFTDADPVVRAVAGLFGAIAVALGSLATNQDLLPLIRQIRDDLLPAVMGVFTSVSGGLATSLIEFLTNVADGFAILGSQTGGLQAFVDTLNTFIDAALWLVKNVPGLADALTGFFVIAGSMRALHLIGAATGLNALVAAALGSGAATGKLRAFAGALAATDAAAAAGAGAGFQARRTAGAAAGAGAGKAAAEASAGQKAAAALGAAVGAVGVAIADLFRESGKLRPLTVLFNRFISVVLVGAISLLSGTVLAVVAAVLAVIAVFVLAYKKVKPFHDAVNGLADAIGHRLAQALGLIPALLRVLGFDGVADRLSSFHALWDTVWGAITTGFVTVFTDLADGINFITLLINDPAEAMRHLGQRMQQGVDAAGDAARALPGVVADGLRALPGVVADLGGDLASIGGQIVDGLIEGVTDGIPRVLGAFGDLVHDVINWVLDLFGIRSPSTVFAEIGRNLILGLIAGLRTGVGTLITFVASLPGRIITGIGDLSRALFHVGVDLITGLADGAEAAGETTGSFLADLAGWAVDQVGDVGGALFDTGWDLLTGLFRGAVAALAATDRWIRALPGTLLGAVGDLTRTLYPKGVDLGTGLVTGAEHAGERVGAFFARLPARILRDVGDVTTALSQKGEALFQSLLHGVAARLEASTEWWAGLPGRIADKIGDVGAALTEKGTAFAAGFATGVSDFFINDLPGKIAGLVDWMVAQFSGEGAITKMVAGAVHLMLSFARAIIENREAIAKSAAIIIAVLIGAIVAAALAIPALATLIIGSFVVGIVRGIWDASARIRAQFTKWLHDTLVQPFIDAKDRMVRQWGVFWTSIQSGFTAGRQWLVTKWSEMWSSVASTASNTWGRVRDDVGDIWDSIKVAFRDGVARVKELWGSLTEPFRKPVEFLVNTVYNKGVRGVWNHVATLVGADPLAEVKGFADGGVVQRFAHGGTVRDYRRGGTAPGYAPRRDTVRALVSPGEGVLVPEATRALGGAPAISAINRWGRSGGRAANPLHFYAGGVVPGRKPWGRTKDDPEAVGGINIDIPDFIKGAGEKTRSAIGGVLDKVRDIAVGALRPGATAALGPVRALLGKMTGNPWAEAIGGLGNKAIDALLDRLSGEDAKAAEAGLGQFLTPIARGAYRLTARFGEKGDAWASGAHTGLDFAAPTGTPIQAVGPGKVVFTGSAGPYGLLTKIQHANGLQSWYAHQSRILVTEGDMVGAGQQIGLVGESGNTFGPHVHLEIRKGGEAVDPFGYVFGGGGGTAAAPTEVGGNRAIVKQMAESMYGWSGPQWDALYALVMSESGFRNTAQNPTSTAYGMFQFLDSTWGGTGIGKTSDPTRQTIAGLRYIHSRYGTPLAAWKFHQGHNWYADGGTVPGTGAPDTVRALVSPGEGILIPAATRMMGGERGIAALNDWARRGMRFATGGVVPGGPMQPRMPGRPDAPGQDKDGRRYGNAIQSALGRLVGSFSPAARKAIRATLEGLGDIFGSLRTTVGGLKSPELKKTGLDLLGQIGAHLNGVQTSRGPVAGVEAVNRVRNEDLNRLLGASSGTSQAQQTLRGLATMAADRLGGVVETLAKLPQQAAAAPAPVVTVPGDPATVAWLNTDAETRTNATFDWALALGERMAAILAQALPPQPYTADRGNLPPLTSLLAGVRRTLDRMGPIPEPEVPEVDIEDPESPELVDVDPRLTRRQRRKMTPAKRKAARARRRAQRAQNRAERARYSREAADVARRRAEAEAAARAADAEWLTQRLRDANAFGGVNLFDALGSQVQQWSAAVDPAREGAYRALADATAFLSNNGIDPSSLFTNRESEVVPTNAKIAADTAVGLFGGLRSTVDSIAGFLSEKFGGDDRTSLLGQMDQVTAAVDDYRRRFQFTGGDAYITRRASEGLYVPALAAGATVLPSQGGTLVRVAEAGRSETVVDTGLLNDRLRDLEDIRRLLHDSTGTARPTVVFEDGAIQVSNPAPEPASTSINNRLRSVATFGIFGGDD